MIERPCELFKCFLMPLQAGRREWFVTADEYKITTSDVTAYLPVAAEDVVSSSSTGQTSRRHPRLVDGCTFDVINSLAFIT